MLGGAFRAGRRNPLAHRGERGKQEEGVISQIKLFNAGSGRRTLTCVLVYVYAYAIGYSYNRRGELEV